MARISSPSVDITLDPAAPSGVVVDPQEDQTRLRANFLVSCEVSFDTALPNDAFYHLSVGVYGRDGDNRKLLTDLHWVEISSTGDVSTSSRIRFTTGTPAGSYLIRRSCLVNQALLDEDIPSYAPGGYPYFLREDDELEVEFRLAASSSVIWLYLKDDLELDVKTVTRRIRI